MTVVQAARAGAPVFLMLALAGVCSAQGGPVVARAASVTGRNLLYSGEGAPVNLTSGYLLNPGDRIDTRGGGRVVIDLSDGSMVVVEPDSVIVLKDFQQASSLRELFDITLGMVRVRINHFLGRPNPYRMNSPTASIAVRGTEFSIAVGARGDTQVIVYEGAVEVASRSDPDHKVLVEAGRGVLVEAGQDFHFFAMNPALRNDSGHDADHDKHAAVAAAAPAPTAPQSFPGAPAAPASAQSATHAPSPPAAVPPPAPSAHADHDDASPRATASTYDRYIAGLSDVAEVPFLFRYNAFAEPHLDSLENPALATGFTTGEARVFVLPTFSGVRGLEEYQSALGPGGTLPGDYSVSPQFSMFTPLGHTGFTIGGRVSASQVGSTGLSTTPDFDPMTLNSSGTGTPQTTGTSTGTFYSGAFVAARRFGSNSFGLELESLKGTGSLVSTTTDAGMAAPTVERIQSASDISQTRITAGYSRDLTAGTRLGIFYRYALISANDADQTHTVNGLAVPGLNSTGTAGHSSEFGMRLRGALSPRVSYGLAAAWLGVSLYEGLVRTNAVDSHQRDRSQRATLAVGLGYSLTPRTVLSFDLAGGAARNGAIRTEDATGNMLQNNAGNGRFVSVHAAVQRDLTRRLFVSASLLNIWQGQDLNVDLFADRFGNYVAVQDSFFPFTSVAYHMGSRFSDFGVGWRFSPKFFIQYLYSTDYGVTSASHTLMLRYTFRLHGE